jgi:putative hydrolase of the HAD superfamily
VIRAVFFDLFRTLAEHDPPQQLVLHQVLSDLGTSIPLEQIERGQLAAEKVYFAAYASRPIRSMNEAERADFFLAHQRRILSESGLDGDDGLVERVFLQMRRRVDHTRFALYDDVADGLAVLKKRGLRLGLLTNMSREVDFIRRDLGIDQYFDFTVTPEDAAADKPEPAFFRCALERAGVTAGEAMHVGDQYPLDILGARAAGLTAVMIDRAAMYPEITDCPRISSLAELPALLG